MFRTTYVEIQESKGISYYYDGCRSPKSDFLFSCFMVKVRCLFTGHLKDELVEERLFIDKEKEIVCGLSGIGHISDGAKNYGRDFRFRGEDLK